MTKKGFHQWTPKGIESLLNVLGTPETQHMAQDLGPIVQALMDQPFSVRKCLSKFGAVRLVRGDPDSFAKFAYQCKITQQLSIDMGNVTYGAALHCIGGHLPSSNSVHIVTNAEKAGDIIEALLGIAYIAEHATDEKSASDKMEHFYSDSKCLETDETWNAAFQFVGYFGHELLILRAPLEAFIRVVADILHSVPGWIYRKDVNSLAEDIDCLRSPGRLNK